MTVTSVDWSDVRYLSVGNLIHVAVREEVDLGGRETVTAIINKVDDIYLGLLVLDEDLMPLPGNLDIGVEGFEAAIAATGIGDRSAAIDAVLDEYVR